jgi:hypothetical protein
MGRRPMVMVGVDRPCSSCQDPEACYFSGACSNKVLEAFYKNLEADNINSGISSVKDISGLKKSMSGTTEAYNLPMELKKIEEAEDDEPEPIIFVK